MSLTSALDKTLEFVRPAGTDFTTPLAGNFGQAAAVFGRQPIRSPQTTDELREGLEELA